MGWGRSPANSVLKEGWGLNPFEIKFYTETLWKWKFQGQYQLLPLHQEVNLENKASGLCCLLLMPDLKGMWDYSHSHCSGHEERTTSRNKAKVVLPVVCCFFVVEGYVKDLFFGHISPYLSHSCDNRTNEIIFKKQYKRRGRRRSLHVIALEK